MYVADYSFWQFVDIGRLSSENCRQTGVEWFKMDNLQFSRCYVFVSFRTKVEIIVYHDNTPSSPLSAFFFSLDDTTISLVY